MESHWPNRLFCGFLIISLFGFALMLEATAALTRYWQFCATIACLGLLAIYGSCRRWGRTETWSWTLALLATLFAMRAVAINPVKPFVAFYTSLNQGMTEPEVYQQLERVFPANGRFRRPVSKWLDKQYGDILVFWLDPARAEYNAEIVELTFSTNRLSGKRYLPD